MNQTFKVMMWSAALSLVGATTLGGCVAGSPEDLESTTASTSEALSTGPVVDVPTNWLGLVTQGALDGTRIQVSHTSHGVPLRGEGPLSYFWAGDRLREKGVQDKVLDI